MTALGGLHPAIVPVETYNVHGVQRGRRPRGSSTVHDLEAARDDEGKIAEPPAKMHAQAPCVWDAVRTGGGEVANTQGCRDQA